MHVKIQTRGYFLKKNADSLSWESHMKFQQSNELITFKYKGSKKDQEIELFESGLDYMLRKLLEYLNLKRTILRFGFILKSEFSKKLYLLLFFENFRMNHHQLIHLSYLFLM